MMQSDILGTCIQWDQNRVCKWDKPLLCKGGACVDNIGRCFSKTLVVLFLTTVCSVYLVSGLNSLGPMVPFGACARQR